MRGDGTSRRCEAAPRQTFHEERGPRGEEPRDEPNVVAGEPGRLGNAVRAMFDLRAAAKLALTAPLAVPTQVAGPSFRFRPNS